VNILSYKGYTANVEFDAEDHIFVGHLIGVRDVVGFHGTTVDELETAFREAVDDYLAACKKLGRPRQGG
jgi:predicted HicB family RNase H-like nuclease